MLHFQALLFIFLALFISYISTNVFPKDCLLLFPASDLEIEEENISKQCYHVPNDLESTKGHLNVIIDGNIVSEADCHLTISKFPHSLRIETGRIDNIYAVAFESSLWNLSTIKAVQVTRNISSNERVSYECTHREWHGDKFIFYCNHENLTSSFEFGIYADSIELYGEFEAFELCEAYESIKIYSYPVRLCGLPGHHENQYYEPVSQKSIYFPGQNVTYQCYDQHLTVFGGSVRTCQPNGSWTGKPPICAESEVVKYEMGKEYLYLLPGSTLQFTFPIEYCIESFKIVFYYGEDRAISAGLLQNSPAWNLTSSINNGSSFLTRRQINVYHPPSSDDLHCASSVFVRSFKTSNEYVYDFEITGFPAALKNTCPISHDVHTGIKPYNITCPHGSIVTEEPQESDLLHHTCEHGIWKSSPFACKKNRCPVPPLVDNAEWKYSSKGAYHQVEYTCNPGYQSNGNDSLSSECKENQWYNVPLCEEIFCEVPRESGFASNLKKKVGSTFSYTCPKGLVIEGSGGNSSLLMSCTNTGHWVPYINWKCTELDALMTRSTMRTALTVSVSLLLVSAISLGAFFVWKRKRRLRRNKMTVMTLDRSCQEDRRPDETPEAVKMIDTVQVT